MKLAEALQERADINRKIEQLKVRLNNNVLVQEGEKTAEDPDQLKQELDRSIERLAYLMARINKTNCETEIDGKTFLESGFLGWAFFFVIETIILMTLLF